MRSGILIALLSTAAGAAFSAPAVRARSYFVSGVKSAEDVTAIDDAIKALPSVVEVTGPTTRNGGVSVRFDTHVISHGQVAYAIMAARPGHAYTVRMRYLVPEYASGDNAKAVDEIMARQTKLATITCVDRDKGLFEAKILPFTVDPAKTGPQGFYCSNLLHPIHDPKPKGLGLEFQFIGPDGKPDPLDFNK
jgi:hypothetical protein